MTNIKWYILSTNINIERCAIWIKSPGSQLKHWLCLQPQYNTHKFIACDWNFGKGIIEYLNESWKMIGHFCEWVQNLVRNWLFMLPACSLLDLSKVPKQTLRPAAIVFVLAVCQHESFSFWWRLMMIHFLHHIIHF